MKTPRQVLLERHRGAEARLDVIRKEALATLASERGAWVDGGTFRMPDRPTDRRGNLSTIRRRLAAWLWPSPWAWGGLSAAWVLIMTFSFAASRGSEEIVAARKPALPASVVEMASAQKQQLMDSLLDLSSSESVTPPRPAVLPRPRSARKTDWLSA